MQLSSTRRLIGLALDRPVAFGIVLIIIWWAITLLFASGLPRLSPSWFPDLGSTLVNLGALLVPLAVVAAFGWWRQAGLALSRPDRSWWSMLPLLAFALSFAAGGLSGSPAQFLSSAILFLALGLNEELLYRGVIQHATNTLGAVRSVVWVALLFGFLNNACVELEDAAANEAIDGERWEAIRRYVFPLLEAEHERLDGEYHRLQGM